MKNSSFDKLIWALIYGGLLLVSLGLFIRRTDEAIGWSTSGVGALIAVVGAVGVWWRSRDKS